MTEAPALSRGGPTATRAPVRAAAITNLGCKVNQAEMEAAARLFRARGIALVDDGRTADLHLVNTCTVTSIADRKSRQAVRRARRANPDARVVVTGCSVRIDPASVAAADPAAHLVDDPDRDLLAELASLLGPSVDDGARGPLDGALPTLSGVEPVAAAGRAIDGVSDDRAGVERTRAFVKVQDGCSFFCTYCIIPRARGPERSLSPDAVVGEVRRAVAAGHREVVLTGINVGTYDGGASERGARGSHLRAALTLAGLVRRILAETEVERIRLSSIEPQHVDDELLDAWAAAPARCLPHFHLPLQSGDDGVLRRMGRRYDGAAYAAVVDRARRAIPGLAVHADVIAGFPTEDEEAHGRNLSIIRELGIVHGHVFPYSSRPGTPAARMPQADAATVKARAAELRAAVAEERRRWLESTVGTPQRVLAERDGTGHAENFARFRLPSSATPGSILTVTPTHIVEGLLA